VAIVAFFAGLARVGPSTASILSTFEPVVTIALAAAVFGVALTAVQGLGAALVLGGVIVVKAGEREIDSVGGGEDLLVEPLPAEHPPHDR